MIVSERYLGIKESIYLCIQTNEFDVHLNEIRSQLFGRMSLWLES